MRLLWTLAKLVLVLAIAIPAGIIVMAMALGVFGALVGLAVMALRLAVIGLVLLGAFSLVRALMRGPKSRSREPEARVLPPVDPHYEAAMRELDRELGEANR